MRLQLCLLLVWMIRSAGLATILPPSWHQWKHLPGVFDLAGPRSDGRLIAAAAGRLVLLSRDGRWDDHALC